MNKKGSSLGLAILSALGIFIVGFMFINFIIPEVSTFRSVMDCVSASTISDGTKVLCLVSDAAVPIYILGILSLGIGIVTKRFIF